MPDNGEDTTSSSENENMKASRSKQLAPLKQTNKMRLVWSRMRRVGSADNASRKD